MKKKRIKYQNKKITKMKKDTSLPVGGRVSFFVCVIQISRWPIIRQVPVSKLWITGQDKMSVFHHIWFLPGCLMTSCASIPLTRLLIPDVLPAHPPYEFYVSNFISVKFYVNETRTDSGWFVIHIYYLLIMFLHSFT